jgi:hypothetical protein
VEEASKPVSKLMICKKGILPFSVTAFPFTCRFIFLFSYLFIAFFLYLSLFLFALLFIFLCLSLNLLFLSCRKYVLCSLAQYEYFCVTPHNVETTRLRNPHVFVPRGKSQCFASVHVAELSKCYQFQPTVIHFLALSGVTVSLFNG